MISRTQTLHLMVFKLFFMQLFFKFKSVMKFLVICKSMCQMSQINGQINHLDEQHSAFDTHSLMWLAVDSGLD